MANFTELGAKIRILRLTLKLSQKKLAAKTNLSIVTVGQIERGNCNPSINNLEAISTALNCKLNIDFKPNDV